MATPREHFVYNDDDRSPITVLSADSGSEKEPETLSDVAKSLSEPPLFEDKSRFIDYDFEPRG